MSSRSITVADDSQGGACVVCCGSKRCKTCDSTYIGSHVLVILCFFFYDSFLCSISLLLLSDSLSCVLNSVL